MQSKSGKEIDYVETQDLSWGYEPADFEDAWRRYLEPPMLSVNGSQAATPLQASKNAGFRHFQPATEGAGVAAPKRQKPNKNAGCSGVAAKRASRKRGRPRKGERA